MKLSPAVRSIVGESQEHVVVVQEPAEERAGGHDLREAPAPARDARRQIAHSGRHRAEVIDRKKHRLEHGEHLMLDPAQPLRRFDPLDPEAAIQFERALLDRPADRDRCAPTGAGR